MNRSFSIFTVLSLLAGIHSSACSEDLDRPISPKDPAEGGLVDVGTSDAGRASCDDVDELMTTCSKAEPRVAKAPSYLTIVLDGSGSMSGDKWKAAVQALDALFADLNEKPDPSIAVGLIVFSDSLATGTYPGPKDVAPAFVDTTQYIRLRSRIDKAKPSGSTPTYNALKGAYDAMSTYQPVAPTLPGGHGVVVLISDGVPDSGQDAKSLQAAQQALAATPSIQTFSVGVGPFPGDSGYDPDFMGKIAIAGGTRATPTCDPASQTLTNICHFQVTPGNDVQELTKDFIEALDKIRTLSNACEYTLELTGSLNTSTSTVIFTDGNGKKHCVEKDDENGWSFDDEGAPTKVILNGQSCGNATSDEASSVRVLIDCTPT